jgi:hypothetical protein
MGGRPSRTQGLNQTARLQLLVLLKNPWVHFQSAVYIADALDQKYYTLLDSQCSYFKTVPGGGVGWFAHLYSDYQEPGYGILDTNMKLKFNFAPRISC